MIKLIPLVCVTIVIQSGCLALTNTSLLMRYPWRTNVNVEATSNRASKVLMTLTQTLTSSLTNRLDDQNSMIQSLQETQKHIQQDITELQSVSNFVDSHVESSDSKIATLAHRVFQLEERSNLDEVIYVFNTLICNASIAVLRDEIEDLKRLVNPGPDLNEVEGLNPEADQGSMIMIDTIIGETNYLLSAINVKVATLKAQLEQTVDELKTFSTEFKEALEPNKKSLTSLEQRLDNLEESSVPSPSEDFTIDMTERQSALEARMNALEDLFFQKAISMDNAQELEDNTQELEDNTAEEAILEEAFKDVSDVDESLPDVDESAVPEYGPIEAESKDTLLNTFEDDLAKLSQRLFSLGESPESTE
eukprot:maker-scaffold683_size112676-snap-gene-0.14 protein:Tk08734 transcript:maker-scaffold683_size112676-snap-gene-0.14-mRNA-1 annotation:"pkd domain protein"